jgi:hypothetical protein
LGERLNGIQEVVGSIPIGSTRQIKDLRPPEPGGRFRFHDPDVTHPLVPADCKLEMRPIAGFSFVQLQGSGAIFQTARDDLG